MGTRVFCALFLLFVVSCSGLKTCNKGEPPKWQDTYTVKGVLYIPYAEIEEPFYAWYNAPTKQSRIDYYGNMVQTYQLGNVSPYGTSLKIAPITTEKETNARTCLQVNGTENAFIEMQSILPVLTGFQCAGQEEIHGVDAEKWQLEQTIGQKRNIYTLWVTYKDSTPVPVRYEMKGYNSLLGSHYDHYYLEYTDFDDSQIPDDIFQIDQNMTCSSFPGPGDKHIYTFNPMKEFIYPESTRHVDLEFKKFMRKHGVSYSDETEHSMRQEVFRQNIRYINSHNRKNRGFTLSINHLADKTPLEMKALRGKQFTPGYNGGAPFPYQTIEKADFPASFDWRILGGVTPVKDQSVCGSCWSFGTIGTIEGANFIKTGNLVRLSQQALVDCTWGYGNNGCDGGEDFRVYQWMLKHGGVPTEEEYGNYLGQDGYCHADKCTKVAPITGYVNVTSGDKNALRLAIFKHGPISVAIDASQRTFSFYSNGVYYEPACGNREDQLDHAVLAVGYGTLNGQDYWLVKNSWSTYWGNDGYVLMSAKNNNCGVMTTPTYVTM